MAEYRMSGHAVWDVKYHIVRIRKLSVQGFARRGGGACPGADRADLRVAGGDDRAWGGVGGSYPSAGGGSAAIGAVEAGAVFEGSVEPDAARRVRAPSQALLGAAPLGTRIFLRDGGRGR